MGAGWEGVSGDWSFVPVLCLCGVCFCVYSVCECALVLYKLLTAAAFSRDRQLSWWCAVDLFLHDGHCIRIYTRLLCINNISTLSSAVTLL